MSGVSTVAGASLLIGTTAAVGATDTFTAVGQVTNIPAFGRVYSEVKFSPLSSRGVQKFKGSFDDGTLSVDIGKDLTDAGQAALVTALDVDADYNFKVVDNDSVPAVSAVVTISDASPGVVTDTGNDLPVGTEVELSTTGTLPTGLTAATPYYIVAAGDTYSLAATKGGSAIVTSSAGSGVHTRTTVPQPSYQIFKAKVTSHTTTRGTVDNVIMSTVGLSIKSGSITEQVHLP